MANHKANAMLLCSRNSRLARKLWCGLLDSQKMSILRELTTAFRLSIEMGDLRLLDSGWYVTHVGLIRLARRNRCTGIHVEPATSLSEPAAGRWAFKATIYKSRTCKGFVGYGDADPSNVSPRVRGAALRVAETRVVNRAPRKDSDIGPTVEAGSFSAHRNSLFRFARGRRLIPKCRKCHLKIVGDRALFLRCFLPELAFEFRGDTKV